MADHPLNLAFRFLLEMAALVALGVWAWVTWTGVIRLVLVILLPVLAATLWAVFRVPGDGPEPVVAVPGSVRLLLELALLGGAVFALWAAGMRGPALVLGVAILVHYLISYTRVLRLLSG